MRIAFKDFFPEVKSRGFLSNDYATVTETVERANEWIATEGFRVLNVETLVLPNVDEAKSNFSPLYTRGDMVSYWYQVVRVWYEVSG
jgi:hypothetical protein